MLAGFVESDKDLGKRAGQGVRARARAAMIRN